MKTNLVTVALAIVLAFVSCKSDTLNPNTTPTDTKNNPGEDKDSINVFRRTKLSWSGTDYKEAEYDAANTPIRYTTQNLYEQGTGKVIKVIYTFINTGNQLTRLEASNGSYIKYSYDGTRISRTEEFAPTGKLLSTRRYQYFPNNRLKRVDQTQEEGANVIETVRTFAYDNQGNLTQLVDATKDAQTGTYQVELVTRYTDYDSHKNVTNLWMLYPILPNVTFQVNNPATITRYTEGPDGAELELHRSQYVYKYNAQGYPVSHTQTDPSGTLTATYTYINQSW